MHQPYSPLGKSFFSVETIHLSSDNLVAAQGSIDEVSINQISITKAAVTQTGAITSAVTANANAGVVTTVTATTASDGVQVFTVNNSKVSTSSCVLVSIAGYSGNGIPIVRIGSISNGSFTVVLANTHSSAALNAAVKISFIVV
jgi:hypothetical protein